MVNFHKLWEKGYKVFDILMKSELTIVIHSLKEKLSLVCDQSCVVMSRNNFIDFVEDQIVLHESWPSLVNLSLVVNHAFLFYCLQSQFHLRINSHSATPNEDVAVSCKNSHGLVS